MSRCKSCGAEIKWIKMLGTLKPMPCDPARRTIVIGEGSETLITPTGTIIKGRFASVEEGANGVGYISHFVTCPNASSHRRR